MRSAKAGVLKGIGETVRGPVADSRPFVSTTFQSRTRHAHCRADPHHAAPFTAGGGVYDSSVRYDCAGKIAGKFQGTVFTGARVELVMSTPPPLADPDPSAFVCLGSQIGPCAVCQRTTHTYGHGGSPLCQWCMAPVLEGRGPAARHPCGNVRGAGEPLTGGASGARHS